MPAPWTQRSSSLVHASPPWATLRHDRVLRPDGRAGGYVVVDAPDTVRVAALVDGELLLIEQHHYLVGGRLLQLPGGQVRDGETPAAAARRELAEETGYHSGCWRPLELGQTWPLPGLVAARAHLWLAVQLVAGPPHPQPVEADLQVRRLVLAEAVAAVRDGRVGCAVSALGILALANRRTHALPPSQHPES